MTRLLLVTENTRDKIKRAVERAQRKPVLLAAVRAGAVDKITARESDTHRAVTLADRKPGYRRPPSQQVIIPFGFRAAFSIEEQPIGFVRHLSVSVDEGEAGKLPSPEHMSAIAKLFGITQFDSFWREEFEPGCFAVNVIQISERPEGHA